MPVDRRQFLLGTPAIAAAARWAVVSPVEPQTGAAGPLGEALRDVFPRTASQTYLNSASQHPLGRHVLDAMERHLHYEVYGGDDDSRAYFSRADQMELKSRFGRLISAEADEIAFVQSTSDGENIVVAGMDLPNRGGNVVVDDLHFVTSLYMYKALEARGLELRVVKHRGGSIRLDDMARAIDGDTRLVSLALVSNINGYVEDVKAISDIAHARGAYLYADMIQAVGAVPLDMRAMGIDFAAASTYKWLMAERGFGLLYVRADLQGSVVSTTRWGHRQVQQFDRDAWTWNTLPGGARYETGNISEPLAAATLASVRYLDELGIAAIAAHAQRLVDRLQQELPGLGYRSLTPVGNRSPIVAFNLPDPQETSRRVRDANIAVTIVPVERRMRVSVSVFNDDDDIDRLLEALA
jgi:selenocysteine lyase/cysteine desulfurase